MHEGLAVSFLHITHDRLWFDFLKNPNHSTGRLAIFLRDSRGSGGSDRLRRKIRCSPTCDIASIDNSKNNVDVMKIEDRNLLKVDKQFRSDWEMGLFPEDLPNMAIEENEKIDHKAIEDSFKAISLDLQRALTQIKR